MWRPLVLVLLASGCLSSLPEEYASDDGPLQLSKNSVDLGTVVAGQEAIGLVKLRNAGLERIEITRVVSSCTCSAGKVSSKLLPAGSNAECEIRAATTERDKGDLFRSLVVHYTYGAKSHVLDVPLRVSITPVGYTLNPGAVVLGTVERGARFQGSLSIEPRSINVSATQVVVRSAPAWIDTEVTEGEAQGTRKLIVQGNAPNMQGALDEQLELQIKQHGEPATQLHVPIVGYVDAGIIVEPSAVIGYLTNGSDVNKASKVVLRGPKGATVTIDSIESTNASDVEVTSREHMGAVEVTLTPQPTDGVSLLKGDLEILLRISRDSIGIPVRLPYLFIVEKERGG